MAVPLKYSFVFKPNLVSIIEWTIFPAIPSLKSYMFVQILFMVNTLNLLFSKTRSAVSEKRFRKLRMQVIRNMSTEVTDNL